jgi:hypothetical protein
MQSTPAEERLMALLANYEHQALPSSKEDSAIVLVEVTRALDAAAYSSVLEKHPDETEHDLMERRTRIIGAATALRPLLRMLRDEACDFPLVYSTDESLAWADNHLLACGLYANALRLAAFERYGLATTKFVTSDHLVIEVDGREAEAEHRETAMGRLFQNQVSDEDALKHDILPPGRLLRRLDRYVGLDAQGFIRYDNDDDLIEYYRRLAYRRAQRCFEAEALPIDALIGRRTFGDWCKASAAASGRVLQHIAYATRLKRRHRGLHLRDLLTSYSRREDVSEVIFLHGDESEDQVPSLLRAMTLDEAAASQCIAETEIPYPLHIEFGREMVLLPCFGALLNPMTFIVRFLRARYRGDWDRAVDQREEAFRTSLRDVLPEPRFHIAERGPKLRRADGSVITDVDAVIVDREFGSLALVQLKWADVHGRSLAERESRRRNLLKANEWVDRVVTWIDGRSAAEIGAVLRLDGVRSQRPPHVFVISRYSSQFTRNDPYDRRAAWFSWLDLVLGVPANLESDLLDRLSESFRGGVTFPPNEERQAHVTKLQFPGLMVELRVQ